MALLKRPIRSSDFAAILAVLFGAALAGCALIESFGAKRDAFHFDHKLHVVDQGIECADCHTTVADTDEPGMPAPAQCQMCHAEIDSKKPADKQVATLFEGNHPKGTHGHVLSGEVIFSHQKHVKSGTDCAVCHAAVLGTGDADASFAPVRMDACLDCHKERKVSTDCATCHTKIRADVKPPNHADNWTKNHGRVFRAKGDATADDCAVCHSESTCTTCHSAQAPANHTTYWRTRAHGFTAKMDRGNCEACHKDDSCERCHSETQPTSHVGQWGATKDRHCLSCHQPLKSDDCSVCHSGTPSHALAHPKPPSHNAAMNCRMCHGHGQPLPHVDNLENCNDCHH